MQREVIFAGFGGQGVLFAGQLLAYAALEEGKEVTWIPSYGPEMRGGTANCTVVVADEEIGSPFSHTPGAVVAFNGPSLEKYGPLAKPGGLLVVNRSLVASGGAREGISVVGVAASQIAEELGAPRLANMVLLGALVAHQELVSLGAVERALQAHLPERPQHQLPANRRALCAGAECPLETVLA
jgi:2-oxoglutarate ferredoxin oxidoreductase subunit gamma